MSEDPRIKWYPDPEPVAEKAVKEWLQLPEDLRGKCILELFSGDAQSSMMLPIRERGGEYHSVDLGTFNGPNHIIGDAYKLGEYYPLHYFDYIIMKAPPIWGRFLTEKEFKTKKAHELHNLPDLEKIVSLLVTATSRLKEKSGCFVAIACSISKDDLTALYRVLSERIPNFYTDWLISSPLVDVASHRLLLRERGDHILKKEQSTSFKITRK
ncbi:MAG: hypothetical protein PVJ09_04105 [Candidatus Woesebacteria bacterium]|jgi:hypothetical protein